MGVMYTKSSEWTHTDSCIVQLLRILPSIRQPPQHLKVAGRLRGRPPIPPSLIPTSKMPPSLAFLPNPKLDVLLARPSAEARGSQVKSILRLIPSFSAAVRKQAKRSRDPVPPSADGFLEGASLRFAPTAVALFLACLCRLWGLLCAYHYSGSSRFRLRPTDGWNG